MSKDKERKIHTGPSRLRILEPAYRHCRKVGVTSKKEALENISSRQANLKNRMECLVKKNNK